MRKRLIIMLLAAALVFAAAPASVMAAANPVLDAKAVCYTPQNDYKSGDCILTASKVMIRRASILRGSNTWSSITNKTLRSPATILGLLLHNFKFEADGLQYKVGMGLFSGNEDAARIKQFERLIQQHPEGVVVWGSDSSSFGMHGVLLVDVRDGVPYVMDSAYNVGTKNSGILKWDDSSMKSPKLCTQYWYIKGVSLAKGATAPAAGRPLAATSATSVNTASTLSLNDETVPEEIKKGSGFPVEGYVNSNYRIKNVEISVLNSSGKAVISKSTGPDDWSYDLSDLDRYFKFGTLSAGTYRYRISATDEMKSVTFVNATFKVTDKNAKTEKAEVKSKLKIISYNYPKSIKKGKKFKIRGRNTSNKKIMSVTVQVTDAAGNPLISVTKTPKAKSYNIRKLEKKIKFQKLPKGRYYYRVIATDKLKTKTLVDKKFKIK